MHTERIKNIGLIEGPLLVFGGVYSNLQALKAMQDVAMKLGIPPEQIICTGDIVAYCAEPEACVQSVKEWGIHCIAGNVEIQLSTGQNDCACDFTSGSRCDSFSKQWYPYAQSQLSPESLAWMGTLPEFLTFEYASQKAAVVHGSFDHTSEFVFASTEWSIKAKQFADLGVNIILAGHCGLPFSQTNDDKYWLNPGVIGMPANDGTPRVWYMLLKDSEEKLSFLHHVLDYDFIRASKLMQEKELTPAYAKTLLTGIWDNCEILPDIETAQQGQKIDP
jgi:predicted phosphodiesterase